MATEKTARAIWEGDLVHGSGRVTTGSGSVNETMTWSARAEDAEGFIELLLARIASLE